MRTGLHTRPRSPPYPMRSHFLPYPPPLRLTPPSPPLRKWRSRRLSRSLSPHPASSLRRLALITQVIGAGRFLLGRGGKRDAAPGQENGSAGALGSTGGCCAACAICSGESWRRALPRCRLPHNGGGGPGGPRACGGEGYAEPPSVPRRAGGRFAAAAAAAPLAARAEGGLGPPGRRRAGPALPRLPPRGCRLRGRGEKGPMRSKEVFQD